MSGSVKRTAILRAEILRGGTAEVTYALEMTGDSVFIVTEGLPSIGEIVSLRLSFPRAVRPVMASASVRQVRMSSGPGNPTGFVADFAIETDEVKQRIADLARRVGPTKDAARTDRELGILLVEGHQLIRDMFTYAAERYFRPRGCKVRLTQAATAEAARQHLKAQEAFDLAVVDHMSDGSGSSFVAALRGDASFRKMPVVGMSSGGVVVRREMLDAGADLFLQKPIVLKDLFCTAEFLMSCGATSERGAA